MTGSDTAQSFVAQINRSRSRSRQQSKVQLESADSPLPLDDEWDDTPLFQNPPHELGLHFLKYFPLYSSVLHSLAQCFERVGQYEEALFLYQEVLLVRESTIGRLHPDYSLTMNSLGVMMLSMGDVEGTALLHYYIQLLCTAMYYSALLRNALCCNISVKY